MCVLVLFAGCLYFLSSEAVPQQFFRTKPHDTEVGQGGTVVIACEVADRRGRVQWTKDGLTLGKTKSAFFRPTLF